ncbi:2Fe-2S iron-sulfur cluster binding domain-containing protein [Paraburkholderia sp. Tr-20389]|uniref:2Fe-2S iron-sulfur cluster-binding protein n=1 Tax=Paraburkholderia sp. Tr-20389 TaxID=2703903 RepID=UPI00197E575F|nr:2Fe-2S iron-sulfur cluster-binding protein [Paraburkholderia sp. Tr-20389]MBN3756599.1 2Fe-2S iron-sulfur cluster binding domain-containing protein [Paraburkholderia sp. Tr-20389]
MNVVAERAPRVERGAAPGFRRFRVTGRKQESESIVSFELVPADGVALPSFLAGQYVTLRLPLSPAETLLRTYSLSGDPADATRWRISVKRESARDGAPAGRGSAYLHEHVCVGDELELAGPSGAFVCGDDTARPVVLMSGGVGLTPLVSMLHRLRAMDGARRVHFIHACENGAVHAFRHEVEQVAAAHPDVLAHFCYRQPSEQDRIARHFHSEGLLSRETLQSLLPLDDYEVYLCGPPAFMQANWGLLRNLGVARERIHYEFFGPAAVLEQDADVASARVPPARIESAAMHTTTVRFSPQGEPVAWDPACGSLLEFAEQNGYEPAFSCRIGICNTCVMRLVDGDVEYTETPLETPPEGTVLLCCAKPSGNVTLALSDDADMFDHPRTS